MNSSGSERNERVGFPKEKRRNDTDKNTMHDTLDNFKCSSSLKASNVQF